MICNRLIIINKGTIIYDGSQKGVIEKFSRYKIIHAKFDSLPEKVTSLSHIIAKNNNSVKIKVPIKKVKEVASLLVNELKAKEISVENPDLELAIKDAFSSA